MRDDLKYGRRGEPRARSRTRPGGRRRSPSRGPQPRPGEDGQGPSAVVLSDGGAKGAYEVGVMKALFAGASPATGYRPIEPIAYSGTSVGGYNAAIMASQPRTPALRTVGVLERIWRQRIADTLTSCGNGVFRTRPSFLQGFDPGCLLHPLSTLAKGADDAVYLANYAVERALAFATAQGSVATRFLETVNVSAYISPEPFHRLIRDTVDFAGIQASDRDLAVTATNWDLGTARIFEKRQMVGDIGYKALLATAAIPGLFPPVEIGGHLFVDGGLLVNTPLKPAIVAGATDLHVVFLDPLLFNSDLGSTETFDVLVRSFAIVSADRVKQDVQMARRINRALHILELLERGGTVTDSRDDLQALGHLDGVVRRLTGGARPRRELTIHCYRPNSDLGGATDLLNFSQSRIAELIERGYQDAVLHDCQENGCVQAHDHDDVASRAKEFSSDFHSRSRERMNWS